MATKEQFAGNLVTLVSSAHAANADVDAVKLVIADLNEKLLAAGRGGATDISANDLNNWNAQLVEANTQLAEAAAKATSTGQPAEVPPVEATTEPTDIGSLNP